MPHRSSMSEAEREEFLSGVHVAVLAVEEPGRGPLALPIWYQYRAGTIEFGVDGGSRKAELLRAAGRATITVQDEAPPYRYVSAEGPVEIAPREARCARGGLPLPRARVGRLVRRAESEHVFDGRGVTHA